MVLSLNYLPAISPELVHAAHLGYGERFEGPLRGSWPVHANGCNPERRLKIGYVSADLRQHSVAFFMEPVLAHHDKTQVEVFCYYNDVRQDAVTERLKGHVDHWRPCKHLDDAALAAQVQADGIDVLVDLSGHTARNRLPVFGRKPAPVQVTYLGYPATTGLKAMDWRLVTAATDPEGTERWHSERLYRLPRSLWCYRPAADSPAVEAVLPAVRKGYVTFGSLNNLAKLSEATIRSWSLILKGVEGAKLALSNLPEGRAREYLRERFAAEGIGPERLELHGKLPQGAYYALLNEIDIALDPYPYNGTTTTCQSLWMGIAVVSLIGETSVSRAGYALLKAINLEALAGRDEEEYRQIAIDLASDLSRLSALRSSLRARMEGSVLRDEAGFTRDLEGAYRAMWRAWCAP
jgi:predicted O-linked N-acetylglucosamine transferase (SPINDLY family)